MQVTYDDDYYYYYHHHRHHTHHRNHPLSLLRSSLPIFQKSASISAQTLLIYFSAKTCSTILIIFYHLYAQYLLIFTAIYRKQILFLGYITLQLFCGYKIWYL